MKSRNFIYPNDLTCPWCGYIVIKTGKTPYLDAHPEGKGFWKEKHLKCTNFKCKVTWSSVYID